MGRAERYLLQSSDVFECHPTFQMEQHYFPLIVGDLGQRPFQLGPFFDRYSLFDWAVSPVARK